MNGAAVEHPKRRENRQGTEVNAVSNALMRIICRRATMLCTVVAVLVIAMSVARAGALHATPVVALHAGDDLLVAHENSLRRIDPESGAVTPIVLPSDVTVIDAFTASEGGTLYLAARGSGLWISEDGGNTWRAGGEGGPRGKVSALAAHAALERTVYVNVVAQGIYRSEDAGRSWELMDAGPEGMTGPFVHTDMPGSMQTGWLFVAAKRGISRSMDCFCLWRNTGAPDGEVHAVTYDPARPERIYAATGSEILRSPNGGEDWLVMPPPSGKIRALTYSANGVLYAGSATGALYVSTDEARTWRRMSGPL